MIHPMTTLLTRSHALPVAALLVGQLGSELSTNASLFLPERAMVMTLFQSTYPDLEKTILTSFCPQSDGCKKYTEAGFVVGSTLF